MMAAHAATPIDQIGGFAEMGLVGNAHPTPERAIVL